MWKFILAALVFFGCAGRGNDDRPNFPHYSVGSADVESVNIERFNDGESLRVVVKGFLGDSCTRIYEDEVKTFKRRESISIIIPTKRDRDKVCTQVIIDFIRVFDFKLRPGQSVPNILVNGRRYN